MRETDTHIYFFSRGDTFSNFANTPFVYERESNGDMLRDRFMELAFNPKETIHFQCSEQAYMYEKCVFFNKYQMALDCIKATEPRDVKNIGRSIPNFDAEKWNKVSYDIMYNVLMSKFSTNKECKKELMDSGDKILVEASPYDKIWGVGLGQNDDDILQEENWTGENRLGEVLMDVREKLKD